MNAMPAALDARGASAHQAEAHTVASRVVAWREPIAAAGRPVPEALPGIDAGSRGATLVRPALARLRDRAAAGALARLSVHAPARLARTDADQVLLLEAFQRAGVAVSFVTRAVGQSPEDERRRQGQGRMAEAERAKIRERHRRGQRQAATARAVNGLSGAPEGDRDLPTSEGRGQGREERRPDAARVVRQVLAWIGRDRLPSGAVCRRRTRTGALPRTGTTVWDRRGVGGMVKNPASRGTAAVGQTPQGPLRPPRRAVATRDVPQHAWITLPVPALVEPEVLAAVQEPWRDKPRHARPARRGAR